ncbi:GVIN1 GTPase, partial [Polypterus senegalus]
MAPPNPSYSQNVQDLKRVVLNTVKQQNIDGNKDLIIQRVLTISEFKTKVQDLWRALLTENFVFSFRNSLEITTYCKLEVKYCEWAWELRHNVLQLENRLLNEIENNSKTKTVIVKEVEETYENVKKEIEKYFQQEKNQEILVQWKSKIEKKYEQLKSELIQDLKTKCQELIKAKEKRKKVDENRAQREEKLIKQSKELAEKLRTKDPSEAELQQEFEKLWKKWEKDAASDFTLSPETDIPAQVEEILIDRFRSLPDVYDRVQNSGAMKPCPADYFSLHSLSVAERFLDCASKIYTKCISWARKPKNSGSSNEFSKNFILEQYKQVENVTNNITETVVNYINKKEKEKVDYSPHYIHEMLNLISNNVETCTEINKLTSKEDYKFDLSLHLCKSCIVRFTLMHQAFRTANDPLLYLKSMKDTSYKLFQTLCRGASSVTAFADFLTSRLEDAINQAVRDQVCIDIANEIRQSCPPLKESKIKLEYYLQKELAEKEEFEGFWEYIHFPKTFFKRHISSYVAQHCRKMSCVKIFSERRLDEHYTLVSRVAMKATETSEKLNRAEEKSKVSLWLDLFCADLEKHLKIPRNTLTHMEDEEINDMDFLQESLMDALKRSIKSLKEIFASTSLGDLDNMKQDPEDILFTQMSGCWAQCPFCAAICTNSIEGHPGNHSVPFHRCDGIKGWGYYQTDYLSSDICTTLVSSDNKFILSDNRTFAYKTYKDAGPPYSEWSIVADDSELKYWKWFVCRFQKELEKKYDGKFEGYGKIPSAWRNITKHEILSELEKQMN